MEIYDENEAIRQINLALKEKGRSQYEEDQLLNIIDMIWDYYEENGLLEIDDDFIPEDDENIAEELSDYIIRMLGKDKGSVINAEDVPVIVKAELDYEDSVLDLFDE